MFFGLVWFGYFFQGFRGRSKKKLRKCEKRKNQRSESPFLKIYFKQPSLNVGHLNGYFIETLLKALLNTLSWSI